MANGRVKFDEEGAVITSNGPESLVGRRVIADYRGHGGRVHRTGNIVGIVYAGRIGDPGHLGCHGNQVWAYEVEFADYVGPDGSPITVDLRRGEFILPMPVETALRIVKRKGSIL